MKESSKKTVLSLVFSMGVLFASFAQADDVPVVTVKYKVKELTKVNTEYAEFSPVILGSDFIFVSDRENDLVKWGENRWKKKKHLNLYKATYSSPKDDSVSFNKVSLYESGLVDYFHSGPICFHPSGNLAVLTRVVTGKRTNKPQLYIIRKENNTWSKPEIMSFCGNDFSYGHACFSEDGSKLFFASDQIGAIGGKDIFVSKFADGRFGAPMNLGDKINTPQDEMYPNFQNNVLYFSSNRNGGSGNLDIYKSKFSNNEYTLPENLGSTINSTADDFSFFLTPSGRNGFFASNRKEKLSDDIYFFTVEETATIVVNNITGKFTYAKLDGQYPAGLELQLLDEAGNVIQTTRTDDKGHFKFTNLPSDQNYTIKVVELGNDLILHVFNNNGEETAVLMSDSKGSFVYKKLNPADVGTLAFMETEEADVNGLRTGKLNGQFMHERLNGGSLEGLNVMLVDEAGNVFATTKTDKNGNFNFSKLPNDQNFFVTTDSQYDDLKLLLYNNKDEVIAELKRRANSPFVFRRIDGNLENGLAFIENEDTDLFPKNYTNLNGKFNYDKLNGGPRELDFVVMDEAGNILKKGKTDKNGKFILTGLPTQEVYIFKMTDDDAGLKTDKMKLQLLDRFNQEIQTIDGSEAGLFRFDKNKVTPVFSGAQQIVYFDRNISALNEEGKAALKNLIDQLKADPSITIEIDGHADASASDDYNVNISMRRMLSVKQYFVHHGIATKRIKGAYFGEKKLVNGCTNYDDCTEEQNRMNRRCEVRLVK